MTFQGVQQELSGNRAGNAQANVREPYEEKQVTGNQGLYRTGFVFSVLAAIGWILFVIGMTSGSGADSLNEVEAYLSGLNTSATYMYLWGGVIGSLAFAIPLLAFYIAYHRRVGSVLAVPVFLMILGAVFGALAYMIDVGSALYLFGPRIAEVDGEQAILLTTIAKMAQDTIEFAWDIGSFLEFGLPLLWLAWLLSRSDNVPAWLSWMGIIGGTAGFTWIIDYVPVLSTLIPEAVRLIMLVLNIVPTLIWIIGVSIVVANSEAKQVA